MNQATLQQKLQALAAFPGSDPQVIEKLGRILGNLEDWDLFRINPLDFAEKHGFDRDEIADYFVRGAKVGLFDFAWNMICPMCGGVVHSHSAIHEVEADHFHCTACDIDISSELDDQVEIAFSLNPGVAPLDLDPYRDYNAYTRYYISQNFEWPAEAAAYMQHEALRSFTVLEPDGEARVHFEAQPGEAYQLLSREHHAVFMLHFEDKMSDTPQVVDLDLLKAGFTSHSAALPAGRVTLHLHSHLSTRAGLALLRHDEAMMHQMMQEAPPTVAPFFTGKMLLNNQTFRDLFRAQNLPYDLNLKVGSVAVLFTDLKGSTELYDDTGDLTAYELVQKHFELLKASAQAQTGAVVKTIGDAVMASFSTPLAAVRAAVDMVAKVEQLNREHQIAGHPLGLKVGLHVGPALAVNANETLDYFGQTVNIAARVQGLAYAGEIWITQPVYETPGVPDFLADHGYAIEKQTAMLKGVREKATVYKCVVR